MNAEILFVFALMAASSAKKAILATSAEAEFDEAEAFDFDSESTVAVKEKKAFALGDFFHKSETSSWLAFNSNPCFFF